ncbi:MAG: hypothetical protein JNJ75_10515 [Cyclobacteriaceae bacterium]|nr:hypothetical protein [Cyclobacteriaceae bacterium]
MSDNTSIGVKIHDIHHGLIQSTGAIVESEFALLKELGVAIQIATTIKDHEIIKDLKPFYAASGELKIPRQLANVGLSHLEKLGFVRLKYQPGKQIIDRIDVLVPDLPKIYKDFGEYFGAENDSAISDLTIQILEKLSAFPHKEKDVISSLGIAPETRDLIFDVGKSASLLDSYTSPNDSESILYSPLYWDDNPNAIFKLLKEHSSDDFLKTVEEVRKYQGLPDGKIDSTIINDAISLGCLPTLSVSSTSGPKKFIFTPRTGVGKIEKELLHKARVLISCVRYGENFAGITKIFSPELIINALVKKGHLRGHTESLKQYEPARNLGLVKLIPSIGGKYEVHFIDNSENKNVIKMAKEMIQIGETSKFDNSEDTAKQILVPGNILHPTQTRTQLLLEKTVPKTASTIKRVNDILRGIE